MSTSEFHAGAPRMERKDVWRSSINIALALLLARSCAVRLVVSSFG
ncbi:MAG: hypothetical protein H0X14_02595 [Acidobacteria bacterium]|nr:hypothetical protein [Acidobacteriota bacterium]